MAINVSGTVSGLDEQLVRDNFPEPDTGLFEKALAQLRAPLRANTLQAAKKFAAEEYARLKADPNEDESTVPNLADDDAVLEFYLSHPTYRTMAERIAEAAAAEEDDEAEEP